MGSHGCKACHGRSLSRAALKNVTETMLLADLVLCIRQVKPFLRSWEKQVTAVQSVNH